MTDLDAIKVRLAAATAGPWRASGITVTACATNESIAGVLEVPDANLIAHAPTDLAALVAEVEELRGTLDAAKAETERLRALLRRAWLHGKRVPLGSHGATCDCELCTTWRDVYAALQEDGR